MVQTCYVATTRPGPYGVDAVKKTVPPFPAYSIANCYYFLYLCQSVVELMSYVQCSLLNLTAMDCFWIDIHQERIPYVPFDRLSTVDQAPTSILPASGKCHNARICGGQNDSQCGCGRFGARRYQPIEQSFVIPAIRVSVRRDLPRTDGKH